MPLEQQIRKHLRYNVIVNLLDGGFFGFALGFGSFFTIIPLFVSQMTDSAILIGLIPATHNVGWQFPQLLTAGWVSRMRRYKPAVVTITMMERLPFLGLAAVAWFLPAIGKPAALALTFMLLIWQGFGGGFTAIPLIQYEMVDRFHWLSTKEFLDGIALGQVTPGPVLITATFVGYKVSNFLGAFMATLGVFFPSFFILVLLIPYHDRLKGVEKVRMMEQGILGSFIGMLALVLYNFGSTSLVDIPRILMAAAAFFAIYKKIGLPYILLAGGILSILTYGCLL